MPILPTHSTDLSGPLPLVRQLLMACAHPPLAVADSSAAYCASFPGLASL